MAGKLKTVYSKFRASFFGSLIIALIYAAMLVAIFLCFTGNGTFLYEF